MHGQPQSHESSADSDIAGACPAPIFIIQNDTIRYVNRAFAALLGHEPGHLIGLDAIAAIHPGDRAHLLERGRATQNGRGAVRTQFRLTRADGGHTWVYATTAPFLYQGQPAVIGTAIDVHERRFAQASVAKTERLEAVGRLAGGIAHDFNNLMQVVLGHAERLTQGLPVDGVLRESAVQVRVAAERAASLTDRLLSLGQRQVLEFEPVDVVSLLMDLREVLQARVGHAIRLTMRPGGETAMIRADRTRLIQALVHLVDNARDAMVDGGQLWLTAEYVEIDEAMRTQRPWLNDGPHMRVIVEDSGPGMDAGTAALVFEPFFTTKPRGAGTGLGLAMVYGLIKQSQGFVWIESSPGTGTRAVLLFPAHGPVRPTTHAAVVSAAHAVDPSSERPLVLIVEDEAAVRDVLSMALERHGFRVTAVASAEDALSMADHAFDLLLTDVSLPGLSGVQLAQRLRGVRPQLPVLLMSGYAREEFVSVHPRGLDVPFIPKPFTTRVLAQRLRSLLEASSSEARPS